MKGMKDSELVNILELVESGEMNVAVAADKLNITDALLIRAMANLQLGADDLTMTALLIQRKCLESKNENN